jgi:hypothetical protein
MDRLQLIQQVVRTQRAAGECERLRAAHAERIRSLQAAGETTKQLEATLIELELEYDRHITEMERLLDELDNMDLGKSQDLPVQDQLPSNRR